MYDKKKDRDQMVNNTMSQPFYLSFNDHPIVSTVLWMLGHDMSKDQRRKESEEKKFITFADDHGGDIAEYIQEVQGTFHGYFMSISSIVHVSNLLISSCLSN